MRAIGLILSVIGLLIVWSAGSHEVKTAGYRASRDDMTDYMGTGEYPLCRERDSNVPKQEIQGAQLTAATPFILPALAALAGMAICSKKK